VAVLALPIDEHNHLIFRVSRGLAVWFCKGLLENALEVALFLSSLCRKAGLYAIASPSVCPFVPSFVCLAPMCTYRAMACLA